MTDKFIYFLILISQFSLIVPLMVGLVLYKKLTSPFKRFTWFFALSLITEIIAAYLKRELGEPNNHVYNVFVWIEFAVFTYVFYTGYGRQNVFRSLMFVAFPVFVLSVSYELLEVGFYKNHSMVHGTEALFLILMALVYFYLQFRVMLQEPLWNEAMFWFAVGTLIYFALNFFLFLLTGPLSEKCKEIANAAYTYHDFTNILCNLIFAKAFLCFRKKIN